MKFIKLRRPTEYPVYCGSKCVIPAGARGVQISFGSSFLSRNPNGQVVQDKDREPGAKRLNVYVYRGQRYHG